MSKFRSYILLLLLICAGCQKEIEAPIIEPGSYYPVYPNSWWKYLVNDSIIQFDSTSDDYLPHKYLIYENPEKYSDPVRVPFMNDQPIYRYEYVEHIGFPDNYYGLNKLWPFLSETVGFTFRRYWQDERYGYPEEMVCVKSITIDGNDTILLLESHWESWSIPGAITDKRYRQFFKNIGLVSEIRVDTATSDTLYKKVLIDYFVNHP